MVYLLRYTTKILFASLNFPMLNVSVVSHFLDFGIVIVFGAGYKYLKLFLIYFKLTCLCQWILGRKICECPQIPSSISVCLLCGFSNMSRCSENKSWLPFWHYIEPRVKRMIWGEHFLDVNELVAQRPRWLKVWKEDFPAFEWPPCIYWFLLYVIKFLLMYLTHNWPRGLRSGSVASRLLELRFRIPPGTEILSLVSVVVVS